MTELGDGTDGVATAFLVVNGVVAVLLGLLASAVHDTFDAWAITAALVVAAIGSAVFGVTACERRCSRPLCVGQAPSWLPRVHLGIAGAVAVAIVVAPFVAWFVLDDRGELGASRVVSLGLGVAALALLVMLGQQLALAASSGRRRVGRSGGTVRTPPVGGGLRLGGRARMRPGPGGLGGGGPRCVAGGGSAPRADPRGRRPSPEFVLADCQPGTVRAAPGMKVGVLLVGAIGDPRHFRAELRRALVAGLIVGERDHDASGAIAHAVTVAVTARGLQALGVRYRWGAGPVVEDAFGMGMRPRARALGDLGDSDPDLWDAGWRDPDRLHVAFWIQAKDRTGLDEVEARVRRNFGSLQVQVRTQAAHLGEEKRHREPFGFVDGVSQPWVERLPPPRGRPRGVGKLRTAIPTREDRSRVRGRWRPIALGEFVLGQLDGSGDIFPVPSPPDVFLGGSFLVIRKLRQDVTAFPGYVAPGPDRESLAARLVGRTKDGVPLVQPPPVGPQHDERADEFTYGHDPEGRQCPRRHIRRADPRDSLGFGTVLTARRRIIRRGMPYAVQLDGPPVDVDRGLLFLAYNVRISEQFEFIQQQWLNEGGPFGLGNIPDPIGGGWDPARSRVLVVGGDAPQVFEPARAT